MVTLHRNRANLVENFTNVYLVLNMLNKKLQKKVYWNPFNSGNTLEKLHFQFHVAFDHFRENVRDPCKHTST